jgi:hypothetical protein
VRVLITGGTGFVGAPLCRALEAAGHAVTVVSREPSRVAGRAIGWGELARAVGGSEALVNLAGEPIAARRWTAAQKARIRESRVGATRALVDAVASADRRPALLVSASAVGYYGSRGDEPLDEQAAPGTDFLATVCRAWEAEAARAERLGLRVVRLRLGVVLAGDGGALARMLPPFRAFAGGRIGSGRQWMSWIHRDDVKRLVLAALADERWQGPVNATAPTPVRNADFARALGRVLRRPAWLPVPGLALRLALGEMADMLLGGQRVLPVAAERLGYDWRHPEVAGALAASVG